MPTIAETCSIVLLCYTYINDKMWTMCVMDKEPYQSAPRWSTDKCNLQLVKWSSTTGDGLSRSDLRKTHW